MIEETVYFRARGLERRDDSEENAGDDRQQHRESEHGEIELDVLGPRDSGRPESDERFDSEMRQAKTEHRARSAEQQTLGQQLRDEPPASRAERFANRHFFLPRRRAGEHEVGDVRAGNQQNESYCGQHHE